MPKVSHRCRTRTTHHAVHQAVSAPLMAAPRKVSFEDNFPEVETGPASPMPCPALTAPMHETRKPLQRTMARPKSSMSLVELAQSVEDAESCYSPMKVTASAPVSPLSSPQLDPQELSPSSFQLPGSPWGQFVEMAAADEEARMPVTQHSYDAPCSCCMSGRRRRVSPYGDYRSSKTSCASSLRSFNLLGEGGWTTNSNHSSFRLTPRKAKEPAEHLILALDRLQVD
mmetsp:Transcript_32525/g.75541  ORF Transcript_32525/g.75541 Transcript_32525/m.75541 type:complete len:227 (+) Transcript_32525:59-739(+)|eukprot:CAMPEP_0176185744 /NCGR_PEP_ID=MMETSP0121_2-20121125/1513_1 /TAXON_ID=160619 /ORGANISM="Kryptoperidinium foliaceum, Strain CCMP 1326" /LENGTH=226 /DNA_ID=CAMNT_0017524209 /DNA_START=126 /DNA_END=806 /DNA_ORIENTATION=-